MNAQVVISAYLLMGIVIGLTIFHYGDSPKLGSLSVLAWPLIPLLFTIVFLQALYEVIKEEIQAKGASK